MKTILLTQGKFTIVDNEDYEWLSQWKWGITKSKEGCYYAKRSRSHNSKRYTEIMHRTIMAARKEQQVDHINGDGLDNRRCNLRFCTHRQNIQNQKSRQNCTSRYKGVCRPKKLKRWIARINQTYLGCFGNEVEAARAYDKAAKKLFGEFARLNNV